MLAIIHTHNAGFLTPVDLWIQRARCVPGTASLYCFYSFTLTGPIQKRLSVLLPNPGTSSLQTFTPPSPSSPLFLFFTEGLSSGTLHDRTYGVGASSSRGTARLKCLRGRRRNDSCVCHQDGAERPSALPAEVRLPLSENRTVQIVWRGRPWLVTRCIRSLF